MGTRGGLETFRTHFSHDLRACAAPAPTVSQRSFSGSVRAFEVENFSCPEMLEPIHRYQRRALQRQQTVHDHHHREHVQELPQNPLPRVAPNRTRCPPARLGFLPPDPNRPDA